LLITGRVLADVRHYMAITNKMALAQQGPSLSRFQVRR
jgi:hypothetical protein